MTSPPTSTDSSPRCPSSRIRWSWTCTGNPNVSTSTGLQILRAKRLSSPGSRTSDRSSRRGPPQPRASSTSRSPQLGDDRGVVGGATWTVQSGHRESRAPAPPASTEPVQTQLGAALGPVDRFSGNRESKSQDGTQLFDSFVAHSQGRGAVDEPVPLESTTP